MAEAPWVMTVFEDGALRPYAKYDLDILAERYKPGTQLRGKFAQPRSGRHHRLYWGVLRKIVEVTGLWANAEALHCAVKASLGMFGPAILLPTTGELRYELQSIDFDSMDQGAFRIFFEHAMAALAQSTCIDIDAVIEEVKNEVHWTAKDEEALGKWKN